MLLLNLIQTIPVLFDFYCSFAKNSFLMNHSVIITPFFSMYQTFFWDRHSRFIDPWARLLYPRASGLNLSISWELRKEIVSARWEEDNIGILSRWISWILSYSIQKCYKCHWNSLKCVFCIFYFILEEVNLNA